MTDNELLTMLKSNIQMASTAFDEYLSQLITVSKRYVSDYGISIDIDEIADCNLIIMYASYLWSKRQAEDSAMPRMLQFALRNRLFKEKMGGV